MTALVRDFPWQDTPLGDRSGWPSHRAGFVDALLLSPAPMASFWGAEAVALFNDAFAALMAPMAGRPSDRLGRPARDGWPEIAGLVAAARDGRESVARSLGPRAVDLRAVAIRAPDGAAAGVLVTAAPRDADLRRGPGAVDRADAGTEARTETTPGGASWSAAADGRLEGPGLRRSGPTDPSEAGGVGDGWREVVHPEDLDRTLAAWAGAAASGRPFDVEHRIRAGDGSYRWMRSRAERLGRSGGAPGGWEGRSEPLDWRRAVESRQALLLGLADTFRSAGDRNAVTAAAVAALGRELGAARAVYAEVDPAHHDAAVEAEWSRAAGAGGRGGTGTDGPGPGGPRRGEPLDALALGRPDDLDAGLTVIASDGSGAAALAVPLVRDGRLRALFHLAAEGPRRWLPEEVALVEDVATRSWDALERIAAAALLRRNQARQSFLLVLGDRLREAVDAVEIAEITAEALGRQLHAARAGYGELSGDGAALAFQAGWAAAGTEPLDGILTVASLGPGPAEDLGRGLTAVFEGGARGDTRGGAQPGTEHGAGLVGGLATAVAVPLIRDGRLRGVLTAAHGVPHRWSAEEIALVGEVASRMWEALERARAEAALIDLNATLETRVAQRTAELASSEARFRILFENAPAAIVLIRVGRDGRAVFEAANAAAEAFLTRGRDAGAGGSGVVGRAVADVTGPDDPLGGHALACAASGAPVQYEATFTVDGQSRTAEGVLAPLALGDGGGEGGGRMLIGISRDITAQRDVEEQLRQAQKMEAIGQLTGGIAHDFNNLLTGIIGSLALMQKRLGQGRTDALERYAGLALASANRAAALTHRLLAFSRRQPLEAKAVDANALVGAMDDLLRRTLGEGVVLRSVETPGLWPTLCDPHQLENALLNLAINARDAMPDGGRLTIETANAVLDESYVAREPGVAPGAYVMVSVSDTGSGMPPEVVARAFDPFFTTKPIGQGTGLGLSMIYGFVKQSDGHIKIYSEPDRGTSVKLFLPRFRGAGNGAGDGAGEPAAADLGGAGDGAPGQAGTGPAGLGQDAPRAEAGETVLLVEDDAIVRHLVLDLMGELGYAVRQAPDGPAGLEVVRAGGRIDLLVTDVGLPGMNGRQFAAEARALRPDLKVLFITGYAENAAFGDGHLDPGMQMMTKPFAVDALARRIRGMIGSPER